MHRIRPTAWLAAALIVGFSASLFTSAGAAGPPAGTIINCWSTATFSNADGTQAGQVSSNVLGIRVARIQDLTLSPSQASTSAVAGASGVVALSLRNLGNAPETMAFIPTVPTGWSATIHVDADDDGAVDGNEAAVTTSPQLPPDATLKLLVKINVPLAAQHGSSGQVVLQARTTGDGSAAAAFSRITLTVQQSAAQLRLTPVPASPSLGSAYALTVNIIPARAGTVQVSAVSPDQQVKNYQVTTDANGNGTLAMVAEAAGVWTYTASYSAGAGAPSSTAQASAEITGPTYTTSGVDMISVPFELTNPYVENLVGTSATMAHWLPEQNRYATYSPATGITTDLQQVATGASYWISSAGPVTLRPEGRLANQSQPFRINLSSGWNQIGSAFVRPTAWQDARIEYNGQTLTLPAAKAASIVTDYAWAFQKQGTMTGYIPVHPNIPNAFNTLDPWKGYWLYANTSATLVLAPPAAPNAPTALAAAEDDSLSALAKKNKEKKEKKKGKKGKGVAGPLPEWLMGLTSTCGDSIDSGNYFGCNNDTSIWAILNPPRPGTYEDLYFTTSNGAVGTGMFATDIRQPFEGKSAVWTFEVTGSDATSAHTLTWQNMASVPSTYSVVLKDIKLNKSINMRKFANYQFKLAEAHTPYQFQIMVVAYKAR